MGGAESRHALYRFYDAHETLLYVGISNDPWRRWREHVYEKDWYPQVKHQAVTWYDAEWEAREAEARAIRKELPQFNVAGAVRPPRARVRIPVTAMSGIAAALGIAGQVLIVIAVVVMRGPLTPLLLSVAVVMMLGCLVIGGAAGLALAGPLIARFGHWLERNTYFAPGDAQ